jgi:hypothetical protein
LAVATICGGVLSDQREAKDRLDQEERARQLAAVRAGSRESVVEGTPR